MAFCAQRTSESCLQVCLLSLAGCPASTIRELERPLLHAALDRKRDFVGGTLAALSGAVGVAVEIVVERPALARRWNRVPGCRARAGRITLARCRALAGHGPFALNLDGHALRGGLHYPHFLVVRGFSAGNFAILDPWTGRARRLPPAVLAGGIRGLRALGFAPLVIRRAQPS